MTATQKTAATAGSDMNPSLRKRFHEICRIRRAGNRADVEARYNVAKIVLQLEDTNLYGDGAVQKVADALGVDKSGLYQDAKVAKWWTLSEVRKVAGTNHEGFVVTWTHLMMLAKEENDKKRTSLLDRVIADRLTTDQLTGLRGPKGAGTPRATGASEGTTADDAEAAAEAPSATAAEQPAEQPDAGATRMPFNSVPEILAACVEHEKRRQAWDKETFEPLSSVASLTAERRAELERLAEHLSSMENWATSTRWRVLAVLDVNIDQVHPALRPLAKTNGGRAHAGTG